MRRNATRGMSGRWEETELPPPSTSSDWQLSLKAQDVTTLLLSEMSQFGGKAPPPWQQRPQSTQLQPSLLGQHPSVPNQQLVLGGAPQQPQYAPVQQSMIQPPGLGGLQTLAQPAMAQQTIAQPTTGASLMGQPPMTQALQPPSLVNPTQMTTSQMQPQPQPQPQPQQQPPQVTAVSYPTPRALAPPGAFNPTATPSNLASLATNLQSSMPNNNAGQQPQKQRVFTGTITKLCADFGFVDEDVFFQTSCVKGQVPKVGDRVLVEATFNPNMPFKWNANRVQVIPGPTSAPTPSAGRPNIPVRDLNSRGGTYNAVPPPSFSSDNQSGGFGGRGVLGPRARSPRRERREDRGPRISRDQERDRQDKEKEDKREGRKRSRSRGRSRSPPRRRMRVVPRYNVQVPMILLHMKEANVLELKKRYSNLYVPSDVFLARPLWSDTFPAHRPFQFPRPVSFHIMNKEVEPVVENDAVYDPPDANHSFAAKVMLMSVPALDDIFRRSCALSEDPSDVRECFVHPTRLINFMVGLKGKNETMAIGGYWSPSLDGANPERDPSVLIRTAIRTCRSLTGIDLAGCTTWYRFAEIYYRRGESTHKGRSSPARVETTVLFLPDVWNVCPAKLEWDGLHLNYKRQLDKKLSSAAGCPQQPSDQEGEEEEDKEENPKKKDPSHYATLDPKSMKVVELRAELDARMLNSKGLKSQLIARLTKTLKNEQEKEEMEKAVKAENAEVDELKKKEEEEKKKEEERKKKEEEEKKKEEEERKKAEERERNLLEKRYTLPDQPMIVVHPSRTAKSGKFDCTTMSLSVLLDYRQEDNKEHSFEVSLFAELFNEMLMRDFAFRIYRALCECPEKPAKEEKKEKDEKKDKEKDKKEKDKKDDKEEKEKKDEKDEEKEEKMEVDKPTEKKDKKPDKEELKEDKEEKKEEEEEEEEMEEDDEEEDVDDEDSKDEAIGSKSGDIKDRKDNKDGKKKDEKKDRERREKKEKKKMLTVDPYLLLSFVYFDQTHTGYIIDRDLEDIINMLGLNLSRAQQKKLMAKVMSRDVLHYRKLTDVPVEDKDKPRDPPPALDLELVAKGNNTMMPLFIDPVASPISDSRTASKRSSHNKDDYLISNTGVVKYGGSLVDIGKLMQQLEKSDNARNNTEEKLKELQKDLLNNKDESKKISDKCTRLTKELKSSNVNIKTLEEELQKAMEDNNVYQRALNQIKVVIRPLVAGLDLDDDDLGLRDIKDTKPKSETLENGSFE
ncbi:hypothetical protein Pcinc_008487 [Petrolisthes cinctipes]|uniref:SAP domain-containing protein n=1 Tax=Petrolisthes cinctipes TaxID=88211 RepID=A0AAE1G6H1_PETCI|nr:hypothetical protein Pcinc_008487 [Petrolisthes cinctipes]